MTERIIQRALSSYFGNYDYRLFNAFVYAWESDFFCVSKSNYAVEVEVKISRSDFRNDFKNKTDKHELFQRVNEAQFSRGKESSYDGYGGQYCYFRYHYPKEETPNKFLYAVPEGLISPEECPGYAGLLYV